MDTVRPSQLQHHTPGPFRMAPPKETTPQKMSSPASRNISHSASRSVSPKSTASRSMSAVRSRSATPTPPNKDKPLPPCPPSSVYPTIDPSVEPRSSPTPPPAIRGSSLKKASKILGTSEHNIEELSQAAQLSNLSHSPKAGKILGVAAADYAHIQTKMPVKPVEQTAPTSRRPSADAQTPSAVIINGSNLNGPAEPANVSPPVVTEDQHEPLPTRGHRRNWGSSSSSHTSGTRSRSGSSGSSAFTPATTTPTTRPLPTSYTPATRPLPTPYTPRSTSHRQNSSLSRIVGSPSSVYSAGSLIASPLDLDHELAETQAFWAAHPLTVTSPDGERINLDIDMSRPLRRRSRSMSDLRLAGQLPSVYEPLHLEAVPETGGMTPRPLKPLPVQAVAPFPGTKQKHSFDTTNVDKAEVLLGIRDVYPTTMKPRPGESIAAASTKRHPGTKPLLPAQPQAGQRSVSHERNRSSAHWSKIKAFALDRVSSVDEIIPMRGEGAVSAADQARALANARAQQSWSRFNKSVTSLESKAFQSAVAAPLQPLPPLPKVKAQATKAETTKVELIKITDAVAVLSKPVELEGSSRHAVELDSKLVSAEAINIPELPVSINTSQAPTYYQQQSSLSSSSSDTANIDKKAKEYRKAQEMAESNSYFQKFDPYPERTNAGLQKLKDETERGLKSAIINAIPIKEAQDRLLKESGRAATSETKASELYIPHKMPVAPTLDAAPHKILHGSKLEVGKPSAALRIGTITIPPNIMPKKTSPRRTNTRSNSRIGTISRLGIHRTQSSTTVEQTLTLARPRNELRSPRMKTQKSSTNLFSHLKGDGSTKKVSRSLTFPIRRHFSGIAKLKACVKQITISRPTPLEHPLHCVVSGFGMRPIHDAPVRTPKPKGKETIEAPAVSITPASAITSDPAPEPAVLTLAPTVYVPEPKTKTPCIQETGNPPVSPSANNDAMTERSPVSPEVMEEKVRAGNSINMSTASTAPPPITRFDSAVGVTDNSCAIPLSDQDDSPILPHLEHNTVDADDDDVSVKSFSHIAPGVETPNYHAMDWWEMKSPEPLELEGDFMQRTSAAIKSWQFDLDDELARLREWDWADENSTTMLFTLDFGNNDARA